MNRIRFGILICTLVSAISLHGQSRKNPFELLHRKGNATVPSAIVEDTSGSGKNLIQTDTAVIRNEMADLTIQDSSTGPGAISQPESGPGTTENDALPPSGEPSGESWTFDTLETRQIQDATSSSETRDNIDTSAETVSTIDSEDSLTIERIMPAPLADELLKRKKLGGAFLALIFLGILLLLTIIVNINRKLLQQIYRASLNENFSALLYRERKHSALNYLYSIAYSIFFINAGLFIYQVQFLDIWFHQNTYALWVFILFPILIYTIRHLVMRLLANVFPISKEINQFNFNIVVFNIIIGLFLIPVNLFIAFGPVFLQVPIVYTSIVAIGLFYIFRQLRGVLIATPLLQNSLFLFFIYLCTVEILPMAVIFKLLA